MACWPRMHTPRHVDRGPMLNGVLATHARSPARGPPGQQAPSKVRATYARREAPSSCHGKWYTHLGRTAR
eukprot:6940005-Alexandrium_andersonii.AAC.1